MKYQIDLGTALGWIGLDCRKNKLDVMVIELMGLFVIFGKQEWQRLRRRREDVYSWLIFLLSSTSSSFVYSSRMILLNTLKLKSKNCLQSRTQQVKLLEEFGKISSPKISGSDKHPSSVFDRVPFSTDFLPFSCKNQNPI